MKKIICASACVAALLGLGSASNGAAQLKTFQHDSVAKLAVELDRPNTFETELSEAFEAHEATIVRDWTPPYDGE